MSRASLRWQVPASAREHEREMLAEHLGCAFTDEDTPRRGLCAAPDVMFVAIPAPGHLAIVAHFRDAGLPFETKTSWLHTEVANACRAANLPAPTGPTEVVTGPAA